jgi:hypothetical protein
LEDDGYQILHNFWFEGVRPFEDVRLVFVSVLTPAQNISYYCKEDWRWNIAGQEISPVLLALTEVAVGYSL